MMNASINAKIRSYLHFDDPLMSEAFNDIS